MPQPHRIYLLTLVFFLLLGYSTPLLGQHYSLNTPTIALSSSQFYVANYSDERANKENLGYILQGLSSTKIALTTRQSLESIFRGIGNKQGIGVHIRLLEAVFSETTSNKNQVNGIFNIKIAFEYNNILLDTHRSEIRYSRPANHSDYLQQIFDKGTTNAMEYLQAWFNLNRKVNPIFLRYLKIVFLPDYQPKDPISDSIFHAKYKPLSFHDFRANPRVGSNFSAEVFTSFGYEGGSRILSNDTLLVQLRIKVYMLSNLSWMRTEAQNEAVLRHEQKHFDITRISAEHFKEQVLTNPDIPVNDYDSRLQYIFLESFREMNTLQEQYDSETEHGTKQAQQERWNAQITAELLKIRH